MLQFAFFFLSLLLISLISPRAFAVSPTPTKVAPTASCQPIFGGGSTCVSNKNLIVSKTIKNPGSDAYVDTLDVNTTFSPNQEVTFRIIVTNNSNAAVSKVTLTDYFPEFLTFVNGPGTFDADKHILTYTIDKLEGNETKSFTVTGRIAGEDTLPTTSLTCLANQVEVKTGTRRSTDITQFCVTSSDESVQSTSTQNTSSPLPQTLSTPTGTSKLSTTPNTTKGGTTVYSTPKTSQTPDTGPELAGILGLLPLAASGFLLRKKSPLK